MIVVKRVMIRSIWIWIMVGPLERGVGAFYFIIVIRFTLFGT